ncbi:MAG: polyisoprenyl-teichoic acid--peptidoglycan teichoic acid transferase [Clostridiales bacterium]|nr:polyisoprenyl-teichoic acid--peptidoglycan teichoic acid transferase [Clostridiales bacterium]MDN5298965.1 polyisoprenyl-teichoic acid--peptidoglycan teichoic acid transferase [Clostridiales bacterium]
MKRKIMLIAIVLIAIIAAIAAFYSNRINILVMGIEGTRTDTMLLVSMSTHSNTVDVISIPRDTYYPTEGKTKLGQKKLNAVYGFKDIGGAEGVANAVSNILGIEIDHTVTVNYDAVKSIVDLLGGVEIEVPFDMKYDDPYATPPLHIDFKAGPQVITGDKAIGYLRFRKSNDGKIREGDVQRIERQQAFLVAAAKKAIGPKLPFVVSGAIKEVDTDLTFGNGMLYSIGMLGIDDTKIHMHTLPAKSIGTGSDGLSYYYYDADATHQMMIDIYDGVSAASESDTAQ